MHIKKEFWLLLASFILPIVLGTAFFYLDPTYFTQNTVNYGTLVKPIITTEKEDIVFNEEATLQGIWTLAYYDDKCEATCEQAIKDMKTIRILTNDNMRRMQRMLLINADVSQKEVGLLKAKPSAVLLKKLEGFNKGTLFLIDPLGNIMLSYVPKDINIKRVLKDLNRLLKYSRIG